MRWIVAAFLFLCVQGEAFAQPLFSPTQDPVAGSSVFGAKGCSKCHAINGIGGKTGPDLGRVRRPRSFYDLAASMWNHLPGMAERMRQYKIQRPVLTPQETGDLIAFLYTLNYFDPPGNAAMGKRLFSEKKCVVCHQVGGAGGVVGPNLDSLRQYGSPIFVAAAMWNHGPAMAEAMRLKSIARPGFIGSEFLDLIAYLKTSSPEAREGPLHILPGRPEQGRRLFTAKRCIECHSVGGQGGKVGPDLAERALHRSITQFAEAMWNKAPAMTSAMKTRRIAVPRLQPEEMADIVAYLYAMRYFARPGEPRKGREVLAGKGCLECHSVDGKEKKGARNLARVKGLESPMTIIAALWNHAFITSGQERRKAPWPQFQPEQMADLVSFLQGLGRS